MRASFPAPVLTLTQPTFNATSATRSLPPPVSTQRKPGRQPVATPTTSLPPSVLMLMLQTSLNVCDFWPSILVLLIPVTHQSPEDVWRTRNWSPLASPQRLRKPLLIEETTLPAIKVRFSRL